MGWRVLVVWECALKTKDERELEATVDAVVRWIRSGERRGEIPFANERKENDV
jgi:G:T-mismatch repair DNA endonuclease (very short patch repair protein)